MSTQAQYFKPALRHQNKLLLHYKIQLQQQHILLDKVKAALPESLAHHACYCVIADRKVFIYTDTAAWASQLRFYTNAIHSTILKWREYAHIETVQIRILTSSPLTQTSCRKPIVPAAQTIKQICAARAHQQDSLSQALISLSNVLEKKRITNSK
ncbi:MAG: DciA family protein [Methylococcales bacterium]|nr:DciA family protein [Methylococcales bacterium]